jgi:hypothetical protein
MAKMRQNPLPLGGVRHKIINPYFLLPPTPAGIMIRFLIDENTVMGIFLWPEV